jgi:hypothetical protein
MGGTLVHADTTSGAEERACGVRAVLLGIRSAWDTVTHIVVSTRSNSAKTD